MSENDLKMVYPENTNWLYDYGFEDISIVPDANLFTFSTSWPMHHQPSLNVGVQIDGSFMVSESDLKNETCLKKRHRREHCTTSNSKACREKKRRDELNDKFMELGTLLESGRPSKTDKSAILLDAVRMLSQLRDETQKLKDSNLNLQEKTSELKAEKNELRDEKKRLKAEKEKLEQQVKKMNPLRQGGFLPTSPPPTAMGNKMIPIISYPGVGVSMWQFMPPAAVDTSKDHILRPPVA